MTDKLFDNFIRDSLNNYSSPVPKGLWEKIIDDKDQKPKFFWWKYNAGWILALSFIVIVSSIYVAINYHLNNTIIENKSTHNSSTQPLSTTTKSESEIHNKSNTTAQLPNIAEITDKQVHTLSNTSDTENFSFSKNKRFIAKLEKRAANQSKINTPKNIFTSQQLLNNSTDELPIDNSFSLTSKQYSPENIISFPNNNIYRKNNLHWPPLNLKNILGIGSNDCPSVNGNPKSDVYVEAYISPDYSGKSLYGNGLSAAYLQKKDSTEKMSVGFSAGVRLSKTIGDHFIIKAGFQYAQINERFAERKINQTQTTTVIISRTLVRPQGDTTINDTTSVTQIGYRTIKNMNHYKNVEIPISVGYEFGKPDDKWKFAVNGGAILNIASWFNGYTIDTAMNIISANSKGVNGFYKTAVGLNLFGSVSIIRNISEKMDVFAEPYFRYGLNNTTSSAGFSQKFNTIGIQLGVRMKLRNGRHHL